MIKVKNHILIVLLLTGLLFISSCQKEEETPPPTTTGTDPRSSFVGKWKCQETGPGSQPLFYDIDIYKNTTISDQIYLTNFHYLGVSASVNAIAATGTFSFPQQTVNGSPGYTVLQGSGTLQTPSTISLTYNITDGSTTQTVTATLTKQ